MLPRRSITFENKVIVLHTVFKTGYVNYNYMYFLTRSSKVYTHEKVYFIFTFNMNRASAAIVSQLVFLLPRHNRPSVCLL